MTRAGRIVVTATILGLVARGVLIWIAPHYGFHGDHVDYVCWGRQAVRSGMLELYRSSPGTCPSLVFAGQVTPSVLETGSAQRLNYPPLAAYVFWATGQALAWLDPSQTANTALARAVYGVPTIVADAVTAAGAAAVVSLFAGPVAAATAFALTFLAPPLLLDGAFWGQTEAWILAPGLWMLWAMARERWLAAGALWGVALALKPSALIFGPLWAYAWLFRSGRLTIIAGGIVALVVVNGIALPFWLTSGDAWLRAAYLTNYKYDLAWTTMITFNVWYVDALLRESIDAHTPLLGVSRDVWGTGLLLLGLAAAFALARRWERRHAARARLGLVPLAMLVVIAAVTLPTRVHGTYMAFTAPFLICCAFLVPATARAAVAMIIAGSLQILSWQWGSLLVVHVLPDEHVFPPARYAARRALRAHDRPREWALTLLHVSAAAGLFAGVARDTRARPDSS